MNVGNFFVEHNNPMPWTGAFPRKFMYKRLKWKYLWRYDISKAHQSWHWPLASDHKMFGESQLWHKRFFWFFFPFSLIIIRIILYCYRNN